MKIYEQACEQAQNYVMNRIESGMPIFGYENAFQVVNEQFELHLFNHSATYSAEIWNLLSNSFIAETVAESHVMGTGEFEDDVMFLISLVFEDFENELNEGYALACKQVCKDHPAVAIAMGVA